MTGKFEDTYPKYPFAPLVRFGILAASFLVSLFRHRKTLPENAIAARQPKFIDDVAGIKERRRAVSGKPDPIDKAA